MGQDDFEGPDVSITAIHFIESDVTIEYTYTDEANGRSIKRHALTVPIEEVRDHISELYDDIRDLLQAMEDFHRDPPSRVRSTAR